MLRGRAFRPVLLLSSALLASVIAHTGSSIAAGFDFDEVVFEFDSRTVGNVDASFPGSEVDPLSACLFTEDVRLMAGFLRSTDGRFAVEPFDLNIPVTGISIIFDGEVRESDLYAAVFESGGRRLTGKPIDPPPLVLGDLDQVTDSLSIGIVAAADTHLVSFTTTTDPVSDSGIIWVTCPNGFDLSGVTSAVYSDDYSGNDSNEPVIVSWDTLGQTIAFQLNQGATPAQPGSRISVEFFPVSNHTVAGDFTVVVTTTDSTGMIENGPEVSDPFTLDPESLDHIVILPDTALRVPADSIVNFDVSGQDIYNNVIEGLTFTYGVTVDSCGDVIDGVFQADKVGQCQVTAEFDGIFGFSGEITVVPGILGRFSVSGTPDQWTAGQTFPISVTVTAYDVRDNLKTDYLGNVWFVSSDADAVLFYDSGNPYTYVVGDQGSHDFPGTGFELRSAGVQTVSATDGSIAAESDPILVMAAPIDTFQFAVSDSQNAGEDFNLAVVFANDQFGNPGSGEVIIMTTFGGGTSPDGFGPSLNNIEVINGDGAAFQTLTNATPTVFGGSVGTAFVESDTITVLPGVLGRFDMAGYPDTITAGQTFADPVTVTVLDIFGNLMTNFGDSVYFTSSDPQAVLPYTASSKYRFTPADSGSHSFPGSGFSLRTAGPQNIAVTNDEISESSDNIVVSPAQVDQFIIYAPLSPVTAGISFPVGVSECRDAWGNLTSGTVVVSDTVGGGPSPDGTPPVYNSIRVVSGSGSANQTLFNAVTTVLKGSVGEVVAVTDSITVDPSSVAEFDLVISSPQYAGVPFDGTALVTAYDLFGNLKIDYDASADTVVVQSSAGGTMQNNVLNQAGHFVDGVADLVERQTSYDGRGGSMTFTAISESGATGNSEPVEMRAITCDTLIIDQSVLSWGDTASGIVEVTNYAAVGVEITNLVVFTESGPELGSPIVNPPLPDSLPAGVNRTYDILVPIVPGSTEGVHPVSSAAEGRFGQFSASDTLAGFPDTVEIQQASEIAYVDGSLSRDTLSAGENYSLSIELSNQGTAGLSLLDSSYFYFTDGSAEFRSTISSGVYIPPGSPGTTLILDSTLVDPLFDPGSYQASFHYYGRENGHFVSDVIDISDLVYVESGVDIIYIGGSQVIDSIVPGQNVAFSIRITNQGTSSLIVDHDNTRIRFSDGTREYVAFSDTSSPVRIDVINEGDTTLTFADAVLSQEFIAGVYLPVVTISGEQNGMTKTVTFPTEPDSVQVVSRARLRIDTTYVMSMNAPFVNISQQCSLRVVTANLGEEPADSVYLGCISDGGSTHPDSIYAGRVDGGSHAVSIYPVTAAGVPDSGEIFTSNLHGGVGEISGLPPELLPPLDNVGLLIIETPAQLSLSPLEVIQPPEAQDDTVTVGQQIRISVVVHNHGQADISGPQRLFFDPGTSGFAVIDSVNRDFSLDRDVIWDIVAPNNPSGSATVYIRFLSYPADANDGSGAVGPDSVSAREFVVDTSPFLEQSPEITWPAGALDGTISTGQQIEVTNTITPYGTYTGLTSSIVLPEGFTTQDSVIRYPAGDVVVWRIRASVDTMQDSIGVASWLYDVNTGDSVGTGFEYLPVTVVQAASLALSTRISGPYAALDGIIEPGAYFEYEATVSNEGEAGVGTGTMSLHLGHPDLIPEESTIRDFSAGMPVTWTIAVPDTEISSPIPVWATLDSLPDEENTGLPAMVVNDSSSVFIIIRELLPRLLLSRTFIHSGSVVKGQEELDFLSFRLSNNVRGGSFSVGLTDMGFVVETNPAGDASSVIGGALLESGSGETFPAEFDQETLRFTFPDTLILAPDIDTSFVLRLTIAGQTSVTDFTVFLDGNRVNGLVLDNDIVIGELNAESSEGTVVAWRSEPVAVLERSFAGSVTSYPNPFNPRNGVARIGYYLEAASDVEVRIFTLLGEEVWSTEISASTSYGQAGLHTGENALGWDGRNSGSDEVRSGVYICIIKNKRTGEEERFKIAVVK
jgi:hypothetical protein